MAPPRRIPERPGRHDVLWVVVAVVFMLVAAVLTFVILRDARPSGGLGASSDALTTAQLVAVTGS
jgi:preprotein translocase subunit SecG